MAGDPTPLKLDGTQFWTPWELLGSEYACDWLEHTFDVLYGPSTDDWDVACN